MSDIAIRVHNLSKQYRIGSKQQGYKTLRDTLAETFVSPFRRAQKLLRGQPYGAAELDETIWALKDVSCEIKRGEVVGIIGSNGAGKTTLLKILSRITEPTEGYAEIRGRVGSLLEVGTGFHPELTGRENICLNGAILGMKKAEIEQKFDQIVDFAEIEKFIDTPVKHYSSGMYVRLAFAVAAHLEPEILLVDEVLAVGDAAFQKKCLGKMGEVANEGRTVLFVSHNMASINSLCQHGIVIDDGRIIHQGKTDEAVRFYLDHLNGKDVSGKLDGSVSFPVDNAKQIQIRQLTITNKTGRVSSTFDYQDSPIVNILFDLRVPSPDYYAVLFVQDIYGNWIFFAADNDQTKSALVGLEIGAYNYKIQLPSRLLKPGRYYLTVSLTHHYAMGRPHDRRDSVLAFEIFDHQTRRGLKNRYRKPALVAPEIPWRLEPVPEQNLLRDEQLRR